MTSAHATIRRLLVSRPDANPRYEVTAPNGYQFADGTHTRVAWDYASASQLLTDCTLLRCPPACVCGWDMPEVKP